MERVPNSSQRFFAGLEWLGCKRRHSLPFWRENGASEENTHSVRAGCWGSGILWMSNPRRNVRDQGCCQHPITVRSWDYLATTRSQNQSPFQCTRTCREWCIWIRLTWKMCFHFWVLCSLVTHGGGILQTMGFLNKTLVVLVFKDATDKNLEALFKALSFLVRVSLQTACGGLSSP